MRGSLRESGVVGVGGCGSWRPVPVPHATLHDPTEAREPHEAGGRGRGRCCAASPGTGHGLVARAPAPCVARRGTAPAIARPSSSGIPSGAVGTGGLYRLQRKGCLRHQ